MTAATTSASRQATRQSRASARWRTARAYTGAWLRALVTEQATLALLDQVQDHDPSGVSMFLAFLEDVEAFARELGGLPRHRSRSANTACRRRHPSQPTGAP